MAKTIVTFRVQNLSCAACVGRPERALMSVPDVRAEFNLATERARVDPGKASLADVAAALEVAGYPTLRHHHLRRGWHDLCVLHRPGGTCVECDAGCAGGGVRPYG